MDDGHVALAREGHLPGQAGDGDAGQRVLVGAPIDRLALDLLGRDVVERAHEAAGPVRPVSEPDCLVSPKSVR